MRRPRRAHAGLTLIELMVVLVIGATLVTLVGPSMADLIATQRVQSINAELVTDLQFARSEAVRRNAVVSVRFGSDADETCYVMFIETVAGNCNCTNGAGAACNLAEEIRTVSVPRSRGVTVTTANVPPSLSFRAIDGVNAAPGFAANVVSGRRGQLRTTVGAAGRPQVCTQDGSMKSYPGC